MNPRYLLIALLVPLTVAQNPSKSAKVPDVQKMESGCDAGKADSCFGLGLAYELGIGISGDLSLARTFYRRACELRHGAGCSSLGDLSGDPDEAKKFFLMGCDSGYGRACFELSTRVSSADERTKLIERACDEEYGLGCTSAAELTLTKNSPREVALLTKGCNLGDGAGCYLLGQLFAEGRNVDQDLDHAGRLYQKACELHFPSPHCSAFDINEP